MHYTLNLLCLFLEKLFAKSKEEYEWLQQSTFNFPGKEELKRMFEEADFINVEYVVLQGRCCNAPWL